MIVCDFVSFLLRFHSILSYFMGNWHRRVDDERSSKGLKATLVDYRCAINDWEKFVRTVQWVLNSSRQRLGCSHTKFFGQRAHVSLGILIA